MSTDPKSPVQPIQADDLPPSARAMISLLSSSLDRQCRIAEQNAERVGKLGDRVDEMGEKISVEIGAAMRHQTKVLSALVLISLVMLGGAAGVSFIGDGFGVSIGTDKVSTPDEEQEEETSLDEITPTEDSPVTIDPASVEVQDEPEMASVEPSVGETGNQIFD